MFLILLGFIFALLLPQTQGTHFAYGSHWWNLIPNTAQYGSVPAGQIGTATTARTYRFFNIFGYRRSYGWPSQGCSGNKHTGANPDVNEWVYPGDLFFYPLGPNVNWVEKQCVKLMVRTLFLIDDWFMGDYNTTFSIGPYNSNYYSSHWRSYFNACCRLSSIRDRNNDVDWTITGIFNRWDSKSSTASGLPRVYVQQYYPLKYQVPFIPATPTRPPIITLATPKDSTLTVSVPNPVNDRFTGIPQLFVLNITTGTCYWTPQITGLYAVAFFVEEDCASLGNNDESCAFKGYTDVTQKGTNDYPGKGATRSNCCTRIPLDFIFQVDPGCDGQPNCVLPPYFYSPFAESTDPSERNWYFYRGVEGSFRVCARDDTADQVVFIDFAPPPATSSLAIDQPVEANPTCYLFKWAPGTTDVDSFLCAVATAVPGYRDQPLKSQGSYCIKLIILESKLLIVSGIVRDFHYYHTNFNKSFSDCAFGNIAGVAGTGCNPTKSQWLLPALDTNHKPVLNTASLPLQIVTNAGWPFPSNTNEGFYDWYNTDTVNNPVRNVQVVVPLILSSGVNINTAIYTFLSSAFFPIDGQGFGNENSAHNYFYTYELNVYVTYTQNPPQVLNIAAADDVWVFIDNVLPANWNLHGIKPNDPTTSAPHGFSVALSTLLDQYGVALEDGETYRCDIFYANRYSTPYLKIELPNNTLCSQLTSGVYVFNWTDFSTVPLGDGWGTAAINPNGLVQYGASPNDANHPNIASVNRPLPPEGKGGSTMGLKIFNQNSPGTTSVCTAMPQKALHGFIATFTFFVQNPSKNIVDGFAFVLNSAYSLSIIGGQAGNLGYGGISKTFAIEFDMIQGANEHDPDFVSCCGSYAHWSVKASGFTAFPYGQVAAHARMVPNADGSWLPNSADENIGQLTSGTSGGRIFLDLKNGTEYNTRVVFQPAADDGSGSPLPGWLWVYMNAQKEPILAVQIDGRVLGNMLGGATSLCFTAGGQNNGVGNPVGYGADIWVLDYSLLIVPTDASTTAIFANGIDGQTEIVGVSGPPASIVAGTTAFVRVQARDACNNVITVGGELDDFTCTVTKLTCPSAVPCYKFDNQDGTYTFKWTPTIAANNYQLNITFAGKSIKSNPFVFGVVAAPSALSASFARFGQLPELYSNAGSDPFNGILSTQGVFVAKFNRYGKLIGQSMFDFFNAGASNGPTAFNSYIGSVNQATDYVLVAVSGSQWSSALMAQSATAVQTNLLATAKFGTAQLVPGNSYVLIARKGNPPTCSPSCERITTSGIANITARGFDNSSISFTRNFTLTARSASDDCGPYAVLNSIFDDIRVPAGTNNQFTIQTRDIYQNLNKFSSITAQFQPDLVPATALVRSAVFPINGYSYFPFYSTKAGLFYVYTSLDSSPGNILNSYAVDYSAYAVRVDPGPAYLYTSFCQGAVLTSTQAGVMATFQLFLKDQWNNTINFQNPNDMISANLVFASNSSIVVPLNFSWQDAIGPPLVPKSVLYASFLPTIASIPGNPNVQFKIMMNINGDVGQCGTANPDIIPGPLSPPDCTFDVTANSPASAGKPTSFVIQTKDRFGNLRRGATAAGDVLSVVFGSSVNSYSIAPSGNGQYTVSFVPKLEGTLSVAPQVVASGAGDLPANGGTPYIIGTKTINVIPGDAAPETQYYGITSGSTVVAGTKNSFTVKSYDHFTNLRDNIPFGISVADPNDYYYRFYENTKQLEGMISLDTTSDFVTSGLFKVDYNATLIGDYAVTIQVKKGAYTGNDISGSGTTPITPIHVIPACTHALSTIFSGTGLTGGDSGTTAKFNMRARDYWTNTQAGFWDKTLFVVTIVPTIGANASGTITDGLSNGLFNVSYPVPTTQGAYLIEICHPGTNQTGSYCFDPWCTSFPAFSTDSTYIVYANITVADGRAGDWSNWLIDDQLVNGNPATGPFATFTVAVTRSDGAAASDNIQVNCFKNGGATCITTPRVWSNVTFRPTVNIGTFQVHLAGNGKESVQTQTPLFVNIRAGPVYPLNCQIFGLSATKTAGDTGIFSVYLKDEWLHPLEEGTETVMANITMVAAPFTTQTVSATFNPTTKRWDFSYSLTKTGVYSVVIWESESWMLRGTGIGSALTITIGPGVADCAHSYVRGVTLTGGEIVYTAGVQTEFYVVPLDAYGNRVEDRSTTFNFADSAAGPPTALFQAIVMTSLDAPPAIEVKVLYTPYIVEMPYKTLTVQLGTCDLAGTVGVGSDTAQTSPLMIDLNPGPIYPPMSSVQAMDDSTVAGNTLELTLELKDQYGNDWFSDNPGNALAGFVNIPASSTTPALQTGTVITSLGNGVYTFTLSGEDTHLASQYDTTNDEYLADYSWVILADGTPITGADSSQIEVDNAIVAAGPTSPTMSLPPTLGTAMADTDQQYSVTLRDQYGNQKFEGAESDVIAFSWIPDTIDCTPGESIPPSDSTGIQTVAGPTYIDHGVWNLTIKGYTIGKYTLNMTIEPSGGTEGWYGSDNCLRMKALVQEITPGPADPPHSYWNISGKDFVAGDTVVITLQVRDKNANNIGRSGTMLAFNQTLVPIDPMVNPSPSFPAFLGTGPDTSLLYGGWSLAQRSSWITPMFVDSATPPPALPIAPGMAPTIAKQTDYGNSFYKFMISVYKAGTNLPVVLSMVDVLGNWVAVPWPVELATNAAINVAPGPPRQFSPNTQQVASMLQNVDHVTAAIPAEFTLTAYDNYGNKLTNDVNFTILMQLPNGYTVPIKQTPGNPGETQVEFTSAWAGTFTLVIVMHPGDGSPDIVPASSNLFIDHATCEYYNPGLPYRCPDRTCVAAYSQCSSLGADTCSGQGMVTCGTGECRTSASLCPCPGGGFRCDSGNCAASSLACPPPASVCPSGQTLCSSGTCRQQASDCPTKAVCSPGFVLCPSGIACARDMSECDLTTPSCPSGKFACAGGSCVTSLADCPTPVSCGGTKVLCLSDMSCQNSTAQCPDQYPCYAPNTYRCPGTAICTAELAQCPSQITCKSGWVKCESGFCAQTVDACTPPMTCPKSQTRCSDGSCVNNLLYCPAVVTCPTDAPVLCWDKSCVQYNSACSAPRTCGNLTCPGGTCTTDFKYCPTGTTCPTDHPVLCSDGSCQMETADCDPVPSCPVDQPVRCPDQQSCRGALNDCPSIVTCPATKVKCPDGTCALALDKCSAVVNCPDGYLRCPGGECVMGTTAICPTHETCPQSYAKCLDGTCRTVCPLIYQTCNPGQVTCPQAAAGVQCASDILKCPQQPTCPPGSPVRCSDASCQATVTNCPKPPEQYPNNKIPCGDGTWSNDIAFCPTPVSCPALTPAKCTDNSCRVTAADCSPSRLCPGGQFLCSTGACVTNPWDTACSSSEAPCPSSTPVACAPYGSGVCAVNATSCATPLACGTSSCSICGPDQHYCRSGICASGPTTTCGTYDESFCDAAVPVLCPDGACVATEDMCNDPRTGCPIVGPSYDPRPMTKCPSTGLCVALSDFTSTQKCPPPTLTCPGGDVFCPDGSCPVAGETCPLMNGCGGSLAGPDNLFRCYDGSCVASIDQCTSAAPSESYPAMCPPSNPFRCPDGYCSVTSASCPPPLIDAGCSGTAKPVQCATGICVTSNLLCPPLNPFCPDGTVRCASDGTCKIAGTCVYNTAPTCPFRCDNGLCTSSLTLCDIDPFVGCPGGQTKCAESGECVPTGTSCTPVPAPDGCKSGVKCLYLGECAATLADCKLPNGCDQANPQRCPDGKCLAVCSGSQSCSVTEPHRCADESCADSPDHCTSVNGCGVDKPYRCSNGDCAKYPASVGGSESCPLTVTCTTGKQLCLDGTCVSSTSLCAPISCPTGKTYCNATYGCASTSDCENAVPRCPRTAKIACPQNGNCVKTIAECGTSATGGQSNSNCANGANECFDGYCSDGYNGCVERAGEVLGNTVNRDANVNTALCPAGQSACPNGVCVPEAYEFACSIIPACPIGQYRYWNGSCLNSLSGLSNSGAACSSSDLLRNEDGWCRPRRLGYDGCPISAPYHCDNRECAEKPSGCNKAATGNPLSFPPWNTVSNAYQRSLFANSDIPACVPPKECVAMIHPFLLDATIDITSAQTVDIALNSDLVVVGSLTIPSGAFNLSNGATQTVLSIRPVPASRMRYAVNEIVPSRRQRFGSFLPFSNTLLSPAFECVSAPEIKPKFLINVTYTAWIDQVGEIGEDYKDVCLARLVELQGFTTWQCLINDRALRNISSPFYVHNEFNPAQVVSSVFDTCEPVRGPGVLSPYNGTVYAFIWSPVPSNPSSPEGLDVVQRNIVWIILGILLGLAILVLLAYCAFRLFRYREKYHTEREEADRLQEEVENMRQFGGDSGNKDDQVAMTANPLAVQLKDVQARYNEEELKLQKAEASLRKEEGEIRAQHIENMRDNRNKLANELEKLKQQLAEAQAANQPKATFEESEPTATYTTDEPVREEFDSGSSAVAPKRGKKDL